jgi:DNA polymerase I
MEKSEVKRRFWLLDVNEGVWEGKPCIRLWGIGEQNKRLLIIATQVSPYFYFLPNADYASALVALGAEKKRRFPEITDVSSQTRRLLGREKNVLRVECSEINVVAAYAKQLPKVLGGTSFDDLRFSERCLTDLALTTCGWNECEVEPVEVDGVETDEVFVAITPPNASGSGPPPTLRVLAIAPLMVGERGTAKPERDPVRGLAVATDSGEPVLVGPADDDSDLLESLTAMVHKFDPDVIVGFETNKSDWPYLMKRAKTKNKQLKLGRDNGEPHTSLYGHVSIAGRANLDLADLAAETPEVEVKTLKNLCRHFGLQVADRLNEDDEWSRFESWNDPTRRQRLFDDLKLNAQASLQLTYETINYPTQLSAVTGLPLDYVMKAGSGFRVDFYILREAHRLGELIPSKNEQPFLTYQGALVRDPKPGLHANVAVLDFSSMYPSLMVKYNLSPDTLLPPDEVAAPESVFSVPEVGHRFRIEPDGFFKTAVRSLIEERARVRQELASVPADSTMAKVLHERERTTKVITNACYGYAGWAGARWYVRQVAESAAALGRHLITDTIDKARQLGLEVIYSDTDSIFVTQDDTKIQELRSWVKQDRDLDIRVQEEYVRVLFTEAMKRYAGLRRDKTLDIVGLEVVRGDWAEIAREMQREILLAILEYESPKMAIEKLRETIQRMRRAALPMEDFVVRKTLTKPIERYRVRTPHVEVARKLAKDGWQVTVGDKVAYVIVKGKGALFQRARPPNEASLDELDVEYYELNQVKPAAMRILELFGATERDVGI